MNTQTTNIHTIKELINSLSKAEFDKLVNELITNQQASAISSLYKVINDVRNETHAVCPHCGSIHVRKDGHSKGLQRYECTDCEKKFAPTTDSVFFKTHKSRETWFQFLELMISDVSIRKSAEICEMNKETAFK
jgi:transposase-like protein